MNTCQYGRIKPQKIGRAICECTAPIPRQLIIDAFQKCFPGRMATMGNYCPYEPLNKQPLCSYYKPFNNK